MKNKLLTIFLVLVYCLTGCKSDKTIQATFKSPAQFEFSKDGSNHCMVIHEGDVLTFKKLVEEDEIGYAIFTYEDTKEVKLPLGKKISNNNYEKAILTFE